MNDTRFYLTKKGIELETKAKAGGSLTFGNILTGSGNISSTEALFNMTGLIDEKNSFPITGVVNNYNGTASIKAIITNKNIEVGYFLKEIGITVIDPDEGEVLYAVCAVGDYADYLSAHSDRELSIELEAIIVTGNAENLYLTIDDSNIWVTKEEFNNLAGKARTVENVYDNAKRIQELELLVLTLSASSGNLSGGNRIMVDFSKLSEEEDFGGIYLEEEALLTI